jgi:hypothetical protein
MRYLSYYLNTQSSNNQAKPYDKANLANCSFNVAWAALFRNSRDLLDKRDVKCRLRVQFISQQNTSITHPNNVGTIRLNLGSSSQNTNFGTIIGFTTPVVSATTASNFYLTADTTSTPGVEINIPVDVTNLNVRLYNSAETLQVNVPEYEMILHFEIEDEKDE